MEINKMQIHFASIEAKIESKVAVFLIDDSLTLSKKLLSVNNKDAISKAIASNKAFTGKSHQIMSILAPGCTGIDVILLAGIGNIAKMTLQSARTIGASITNRINQMKLEQADIYIDISYHNGTSDMNDCHLARNIALGLSLKNYNFNKYYVAKKDEHETYLKSSTFMVSHPEKTAPKFNDCQLLINAVTFTRDLVSEPGNVIYPESLMKKCMKLADLGLKVKALDETEMKNRGMGSLLGVAQGSENKPYLVVMEWLGGEKGEAPLALVGKGVTFDTGGISLKPATHMGDMKYDMAGAAAVTGTMMTLASRRAKVNAVGVVGLVENMPSGKAQRPGDVVKSMSGQTIEVDNTDAEGRLVLADAMWYIQEQYKPKILIDLATLTGAIVVALGDGHAGIFSNNDQLSDQLITAGKNSGELLWRLPISDYYDKQINSDIADVKNVGQSSKGGGGGAGSITAAQFLNRFVQDGTNWAHLDIAGMAWNYGGGGGDLCPKGATGFGVRLLDEFIRTYYEQTHDTKK